MEELNVLTLAHFHKTHKNYNRIFEHWCEGIKANSTNYHFIDYIDRYSDAGRGAFEEQVERFVIENKISYVFIVFWSGDLTLDVNFLKRLSKSAFIVMSFFDTEHYFEAVDRYYAQAADLVLLTDYLPKYKYELLGINAFCTFSLFNSDHYKKLNEMDKNIDVSFVGDVAKGNRREYIDYLLENEIPIQCYGINTEKGFIDFNKMIEVFNKSKINLNFTEMVDNSSLILGSEINNRIRQCKGRPIEVALCGGGVLSEYAPGIENMFKVGEEIEIFRTREELLEKIKYYLRNETLRERIAQKGYERALNNYDSRSGFAKIFTEIKNCRKSEPVIYLDDDFIKNYTSYRFRYIVRFLFRGRISGLFDELKVIAKNRKLSFSKAFRYALKELLENTAYFLSRHPYLKSRLKIFCIKIKV